MASLYAFIFDIYGNIYIYYNIYKLEVTVEQAMTVDD